MDVKTNTLPAVAVTVLGYVAAMLGGWLVQHGYITGDQTSQVSGAVLGIGALVYGAARTHINKGKIQQAEALSPGITSLKS